MTQYDNLKSAFIRVVGQPIKEKAPDTTDDRDPSQVCWLSRNIWLHPGDPDQHDIQLASWSGEAWVGQTSRLAGLWFGLSMEFKDIFAQVLSKLECGAFNSETRRLVDFRITLGQAWRSSAQFSPICAGIPVSEADWAEIWRRIRQINGHKGLPRPHLQIYAQMGKWNASSNTIPALVERITDAHSELASLIDVILR